MTLTINRPFFAKLMFTLLDLQDDPKKLALFLTSEDEDERELAAIIVQRLKDKGVIDV